MLHSGGYSSTKQKGTLYFCGRGTISSCLIHPMAAFSNVLTLLPQKSKMTAAELGDQLQPHALIRYANYP